MLHLSVISKYISQNRHSLSGTGLWSNGCELVQLTVLLLPGPAQPNHSSKMNPVIADVVSLANGSAAQPSVSAATVLTGQSIHAVRCDRC